MNADGSEQTRLTDSSVSNCDASYPAWSPDGQKIAFVLQCPGDWPLYLMDIDGTNQSRVTYGLSALFPAWSPDSKSIVFSSDSDGKLEIYKIFANGMEETRLTDNSVEDVDPTWSP
jgi:TolB protein